MDRKVIWSSEAVADLEAAAEYIARDSEHYSAAFVEEVLDAVYALSEFSERGQIVPEFGDPLVRELLVAPYRVVYELSEAEVAVLAIVHGARRRERY